MFRDFRGFRGFEVLELKKDDALLSRWKKHYGVSSNGKGRGELYGALVRLATEYH